MNVHERQAKQILANCGILLIGGPLIETLPLSEADQASRWWRRSARLAAHGAAKYAWQTGKPVAASIACVSAPKGKRMGHAGAIISGKSAKVVATIRLVKAAGAWWDRRHCR